MTIQKNFKITNGLEVYNDLIFADRDQNSVGIGTSVVTEKLFVNGGIGATSIIISGISTINNLVIDGTISIGNTVGTSNQYLTSTGVGVSWKSVSSPRTSTVYSAGIGSISFSATYEVGLIDVYVNGVRLVPPPSPFSEFTASSGTSIVLNDPCFGGEIVELVAYNSI
jgi:hypothetical protein